jgi:negative regulator of sigma E activity
MKKIRGDKPMGLYYSIHGNSLCSYFYVNLTCFSFGVFSFSVQNKRVGPTGRGDMFGKEGRRVIMVQ